MKIWIVIIAIGLLTACGGGGGGGGTGSATTSADANAADGLGVSGLAAGTTAVGTDSYNNFPGRVSVALADDGRALVVWVMHAASYVDYSTAWNQSDLSGQWGSQRSLTQANGISDYGPVLRMNASGNAVLGWLAYDSGTGTYVNRAARFIEGAGWDASSYDASGGSIGSNMAMPNSWDLALLADNSFTTSVRVRDPSSGNYYIQALRQPTNASAILSLATSPDTALIYYPYSFLAVRQNGDGILSWVDWSSVSPGQLDIRAEFVSVYSGALAPFTIATYPALCYATIDGAYFNALIAATSPTSYSAFAVVAQDAVASPNSCLFHDLELIRLDMSGISVRTTRVNAPGTAITIAPVIVMDQNGNALAVWKESSGTGATQTKLMWSASLQGGAWSSPLPVMSNQSEIGVIPRLGEISLAMNDNGEAVAALVTNDADSTLINPSVSYGRFSFTSGWTAWKRAANKTNVSDPKVAINRSGNAIVVYTAVNADRVGGRASTAWSGANTTTIYAFRF